MEAMNTRLKRAVLVIEEAMELALGFFEARSTIATRTKGFQDFVSEADTSVERLVRDRLGAAFPGETVLGEEMGGVADDAYWIIDPIDGTANFLRGSPLWGISLGFVRNGRPEIGIVAVPVLGEIYSAADGTGLRVNGKPRPRDVPFEDVQVMSLGDSAAADAEEVAALNVGLRHAGWVVESNPLYIHRARLRSTRYFRWAPSEVDHHVGYRRWSCSCARSRPRRSDWRPSRIGHPLDRSWNAQTINCRCRIMAGNQKP
jgi:myo-inositol-1(or 4)-monophosphatase